MPRAKLTGEIWTDSAFFGHDETPTPSGATLRMPLVIPRGAWFIEVTVSLQLRNAEMLIALDADNVSYGSGIGSSKRTAADSLDSVTALALMHNVRVTSAGPQTLRIAVRPGASNAAHGALGYAIVAHRQKSSRRR